MQIAKNTDCDGNTEKNLIHSVKPDLNSYRLQRPFKVFHSLRECIRIAAPRVGFRFNTVGRTGLPAESAGIFTSLTIYAHLQTGYT